MINSQPYFYDQITAIYSKYVVVGMKYEIQVTSTTGKEAYVLVRPTAGLHTPTVAIDQWLWVEEQRPNAKKYRITSGHQTKKIKGYVDIAKIWGCSRDA